MTIFQNTASRVKKICLYSALDMAWSPNILNKFLYILGWAKRNETEVYPIIIYNQNITQEKTGFLSCHRLLLRLEFFSAIIHTNNIGQFETNTKFNNAYSHTAKKFQKLNFEVLGSSCVQLLSDLSLSGNHSIRSKQTKMKQWKKK